MKKPHSSKPLSTNDHLLRWVEKMVELCKPASVHWVDGSQEEYDELCAQMVAGGTAIKLNEKLWPGCYYVRSDPGDVARVEDRTYICSLSKEAAGPTNNWVNPYEMRKTLRHLFSGCMAGRRDFWMISMCVRGSKGSACIRCRRASSRSSAEASR